MSWAFLHSYRSHGVYPLSVWSMAGRTGLPRPANIFVCNDNWHPITDGDTA